MTNMVFAYRFLGAGEGEDGASEGMKKGQIVGIFPSLTFNMFNISAPVFICGRLLKGNHPIFNIFKIPNWMGTN